MRVTQASCREKQAGEKNENQFLTTAPRCGEEIEFALPEITVGREEDNVLRVPAPASPVTTACDSSAPHPAPGWSAISAATNGIKVNGVKIAGEKELAEGDSVEFGDQKIQVSGLGETAPPLVFNLLDAEQPGPSARATSRLPEEPPAAPKSEAKVEDLTALFTAGAGTLFDRTAGKRRRRNGDGAAFPDGNAVSPAISSMC